MLWLCGPSDTDLLKGVGSSPSCELSALRLLAESGLSVLFTVLIILGLVSVGSCTYRGLYPLKTTSQLIGNTECRD